MDSKRRFDRCGVCGGNASTCTKVSKEYTDNPATSGKHIIQLLYDLQYDISSDSIRSWSQSSRLRLSSASKPCLSSSPDFLSKKGKKIFK